ncbi:hypothetical protein NGB36_14815 [Streptomyces sp. RB6PN25]|uniref:Sigma-70 family RNA polymerase sigma factor n=1 Tax=Streptomyces humicola TaxID=2953240 RepID=A0ABT1PZ89_9ACTN|nr:hypothetical protein [Streptomyces humicola]MCQ4081845.1 hypothetical protein [Streptomyces humicola]
MHHARRPARRSVRTDAVSRSPLQALEESFLALSAAPCPLTLPAHLVYEAPEQSTLIVDQVRTRLAHPATAPGLREQTWREVVRRAQQLGWPWDTVAVAMTIPVLRRMLAHLARPSHLERAEVEQEALAAVATAVHTVDAGAADVGRELFSAANRAVYRLAYAARRQAAQETEPLAQEAEPRSVHPAWLAESAGPAGYRQAEQLIDTEGDIDEYAVLARAVQARAVDVDEARLIARTRLEGEPMQRLAAERGVSARQLYRHRAAAEQHLTAYLKTQMRQR